MDKINCLVNAVFCHAVDNNICLVMKMLDNRERCQYPSTLISLTEDQLSDIILRDNYTANVREKIIEAIDTIINKLDMPKLKAQFVLTEYTPSITLFANAKFHVYVYFMCGSSTFNELTLRLNFRKAIEVKELQDLVNASIL